MIKMEIDRYAKRFEKLYIASDNIIYVIVVDIIKEFELTYLHS